MVDWIEPLKLQDIFTTIFAGDPDIFIAIALMIIATMAAFFRMTIAITFFMIALFILMFSEVSTPPMVVLFSVIGGLVVGYILSKVFNFN